MAKQYFVYILSSYTRTLYIGITNDLQRRVNEHKNEVADGFTARYNVNRLVYFEVYTNIHDALAREKQLKDWARAKKDGLIETMNPEWNDLSDSF